MPTSNMTRCSGAAGWRHKRRQRRSMYGVTRDSVGNYLPQRHRDARRSLEEYWSLQICHLKLVISEMPNYKLQIINNKFGLSPCLCGYLTTATATRSSKFGRKMVSNNRGKYQASA